MQPIKNFTIRAKTHQESTVELTPMDHLLRFSDFNFVYIYDCKIDAEEFVSNLKKLVNHFPFMAGRLSYQKKKGLQLKCQNQGFPVSLWQTEQDSESIIESKNQTLSFFIDRIDIVTVISKQKPLIKIKITFTKDNKTVLGFSFHHSLGDGRSVTLLLHNLSNICKNKPVLELNLDRQSAFEPYITGENPENSTKLSNFVRKRNLKEVLIATSNFAKCLLFKKNGFTILHFSEEEVNNIKSTLTGASKGDALVAHLLDVLYLLESENSVKKYLHLFYIISVEGKVKPIFPKNCISNAISFSVGNYRFTSEELQNKQYVVDEIRKSIEPNYVNKVFRQELAWLQRRESDQSIRRNRIVTSYDFIKTTYALSNMTKVDPYAFADFGFGKPDIFLEHNIFPNTLFMYRAEPARRGVYVSMNIKKEFIKKLQTDHWQKILHKYL